MKLVFCLFFSLFISSAYGVTIREGDRVIDQYGNTGDVLRLYSDLNAEIILDAYPDTSFIRPLSSLGKAYRCVEHICVGRRIVDQFGNSGKINEIFHNGISCITLEHQPGYFTRTLRSLGIHLDCLADATCSLKSK